MVRWMRAFKHLGLAFLVLGTATSSTASPSATSPSTASLSTVAENTRLLKLRYRAPAECPSATDFESEVASLLQNADEPRRETPVQVEIVALDGTPYTLSLSIFGGNRTVSGDDCVAVVRAAALFVALLLEDPGHQPAPPAPPQSASPPTAPIAASSPHDDRGNRLRPFFGVSGGLDTKTLPRMGEILGISAGIIASRFTLEAVATAGLPQQQSVDLGRTLRASFLIGGARSCYHTFIGRWLQGGPCFGLQAGVITAEGLELSAPRKANAEFLAAALGAQLWLFAQRSFAMTLEGDWVGPLVRPEIYFDGPGPPVLVHQPGASFQARLGLRWVLARSANRNH